MKMQFVVRNAVFCLALSRLIVPFAAHAQSQVLGEVKLVGKTKADKTVGVWVDGQYLGYVMELKDDKKILLMPGEHEIAVRQAGYTDFTKKVVVEPRKKTEVEVVMLKDPRTRLPTVTSLVKLKVTPDRAAVFVDDAFAGTVAEFSGVGHGMLVSPGKDRKSTRLNSSHDQISYAVFCLKKKRRAPTQTNCLFRRREQKYSLVATPPHLRTRHP